MPVAVVEEKKKAIARRFLVELWGEGKLELANELVTSNFIEHDPYIPQQGRGPESYKKAITVYRTAFPDLKIGIEETVCEGDKAAMRFSARGTHKGDLMGIKPTGKRFNITGTVTFHFSNHRITECWTNWNALGMLEQLGVLRNPLTGK